MSRAVRLLALVAAALVALVPGSPVAAQVDVDDVEVIIAIDTSESMKSAIEAAKAAARDFVTSMPDGVRIGVEIFADQVTVLTPPTDDRNVLMAQIDGIATGGDTALYDVVVGARDHFTPGTEHRVIVLLTDGKDEGSAATLADAVGAAEGIQIEAISLTTKLTDLESLRALGQVTSAADTAAVAAAFERVAGLLVEVIEPTPTTTPATTAPATTVPATTVPATTAAPVTTLEPPPASLSAVPVGTTDSVSSTWLWIGGGALFIGLFVLAALLFPQRRVSKARLGTDKPRRASDFGVRAVSAIDEALERHGKRAGLAESLAVADVGSKPAEFVAMVVLVAGVVGVVGLALVGPLIGLVAALIVGLGAWAYVARTASSRRAAFSEQLPDVLQLVSTALRSGFGLTQSLESVAEDAEEPARSEFAQVLAEVRLGRDLSDAMYALASRMRSKDLGWVVSAIDINREAGGNLAEVLETVGETIRERGRVARQVRTLTAEGRLSARILTAMPLLMLFWQWRVNPDNFDLLTHGVGLAALVVAGFLMVLGSTWVFKLVKSVAL